MEDAGVNELFHFSSSGPEHSFFLVSSEALALYFVIRRHINIMRDCLETISRKYNIFIYFMMSENCSIAWPDVGDGGDISQVRGAIYLSPLGE